ADVRAHEEPEVGADAVVLTRLRGQSPQWRPRTDQREQAELERALVKLGVEADVEAPQRVEQGLQRGALAQEQQFVAGVEYAEVGEHLALGGEQRRVAAGPRLERL